MQLPVGAFMDYLLPWNNNMEISGSIRCKFLIKFLNVGSVFNVSGSGWVRNSRISVGSG